MENSFTQSYQRVSSQSGGAREIRYRGINLLFPLDGLEQAVEILRRNVDRAHLLNRVNALLDQDYDECARLLKRGAKTSHEQHPVIDSYVQNVVVWFANEIVEGRATLSHTIN